jgi:hypothetical protein
MLVMTWKKTQHRMRVGIIVQTGAGIDQNLPLVCFDRCTNETGFQAGWPAGVTCEPVEDMHLGFIHYSLPFVFAQINSK